MNIAEWFRGGVEAAKLRKNYARLVKTHETVSAKLAESRSAILSLTSDERTYTANRYTEQANAISEIAKKYQQQSMFGSRDTANIIDFRAAMITGDGGVKFETQDKKLQVFIDEFIEYNNLDYEAAQDAVISAEIEGRYLVRLKTAPNNQVEVEYIPWLEKKYVVTLGPGRRVEGVSWRDTGGVTVNLKAEEFVYVRFGGLQNQPNVAVPKIQRCLTQVEDLDNAFRDWREINRLFASPTPYFRCPDTVTAEKVMDAIDNSNWRIKKAFASTADFSLVGPGMEGVKSLENEIIRNACFIAGSTGYPIQFLIPDVLSNRSTAENIMESAVAHTAREREVWLGFYHELIGKSAKLSRPAKTPYDLSTLSISMPRISNENWDRLIRFWLPARQADVISQEAFLSQVPGIDAEMELERAEVAGAAEREEMRREIENLEAVNNERENKVEA